MTSCIIRVCRVVVLLVLMWPRDNAEPWNQLIFIQTPSYRIIKSLLEVKEGKPLILPHRRTNITVILPLLINSSLALRYRGVLNRASRSSSLHVSRCATLIDFYRRQGSCSIQKWAANNVWSVSSIPVSDPHPSCSESIERTAAWSAAELAAPIMHCSDARPLLNYIIHILHPSQYDFQWQWCCVFW